jgi:demethylmenaquinone methyltransferase/2-methoxy-6-polyprenyl-1,4-benzoquinol methylase
MQNPESKWFGEKEIKDGEKTDLVRGVFDSVAPKYDIMNDLMSAGVHRLWKRRLISQIRPRKGKAYLDVAGGTGDIAFRIREAIGEKSDITLCDINDEMLEVGQQRAINRGWLNEFEWVTSDAAELPFEDNRFDVYTISFGLRNVTRIDDALKEAHRVLKPGGRFYCLEFSRVQDPTFAKLYDLYSFNVIPRIGQAVAKDAESYQYLVESIRKHPDQKALARRMRAAGFENVGYDNLNHGIAAIHRGWKS